MERFDKFDSELASMTYRKHSARLYSSNTEQLLDEYLEICAAHSADPVARALHLSFVQQVDQMRGLLTTMKATQTSAHHGIGSQATTAIIKSEWNKDYYKKLRYSWNAPIRELTSHVVEAAVAWIAENNEYEGYDEFKIKSEKTCYVPTVGVVLQLWEDKKDAKNYIDSLHVAINAPLSRFYTPCAMCTEILGYVVVSMTLCPVEEKWSGWRDTVLAQWAFDAVCASLRLTKLSGPKMEASSPQVAGGASNANRVAAAEEQVEKHLSIDKDVLPDLCVAAGQDGKWYALDFRSVPVRSLPSPEEAPKRPHWPRRELLFSASGVCSTPYSPTDFITKFKLKVIADQLINIGGAGAPGPADQSLVSTLMHFHGVSFGAYIFQLFYTIVEQERIFQAGIQTANRKAAAMTPNTIAKLKRFVFCKSLVVSELIARIIKRFIREEWFRIASSKTFMKSLLAAINEEEQEDEFDIDADQKIMELNQPFIESTNAILQSIFIPSSNIGDRDEEMGAKPSNKNTALQLSIEPEMLETLVFLVNDAYVNNVCAPAVLRGNARFSAKEDDIDISRVVFCLNQMLHLNITLKPKRIFLEGGTDFFAEEFFDLEGVTSCALRSEPYTTSIDLPVCLVTGSKAKMNDFVDLQQRIASKILSTIDVTQHASMTSHLVSVVKFILLYANDVTVAQRGSLQDQDYEDIARVHSQVPFRMTPVIQKMIYSFDAMVSFRRAWFLSGSDLQGSLRNLMKSAEKSRPLFESTAGTAMVLTEKVTILCRVCEHFMATGMELLTSLEMALQDLNQLLQSSSALGVGRLRRNQAGELKLVHCYPLHLTLLSLLVKHVLHRGNRSGQADSIGQAVKHCSKRRDVIAEVFGERSVEAGLACNDVAAICSNNRYDFEKAEEEFERAVLILREAQPEGPAVFVTMNNLAFLYFRKAERLRKNPQLAKDYKAKGETIGNVLAKAEELLDIVINAEGKVGVMDYAAALNNLASIKLFRNQFNDARRHFSKTLEVTEHLVRDGEAELPCRAHAIKNMKVLARKQYVSAVLKVQANVRRFITKMRNQKAVTHLRAAKPIQRIGRAMILRIYIAKHYRFSAFNSWMRKPRCFTSKLDPSYHPLPLEARCEAWQDLRTSSAKRLQKVIKGFSERENVGKLRNFQKTHFEHRRPALFKEVTRRRTLMFSGEALRLTIFLCSQAVGDLLEIQLRATRYESYIAVDDVYKQQFKEHKFLMEDAEESGRYAISQEERRERTQLSNFMNLHSVESKELIQRGEFICDAMVELYELHNEFLWPIQQHAYMVSILHKREFARLEMLEKKIRNNIVMEFTVLMQGEYMISVVPRVGRGYLMRKWANRMRLIFHREEFQRREIEVDEADHLHFPTLETQWQTLALSDVEKRERAAMEAECWHFFDIQENYSDIALVLTEFNSRSRLEDAEAGAFQFDVLNVNEQDLIIVEEKHTRIDSVFVEQVFTFIEDILFAAEVDSITTIAAQYHHETVIAMKRSAVFAQSMLEKQESLERNEILREEDQLHFLTVRQPFAYEGELSITESIEYRDIQARIAHQIRRQIMMDERKEDDEKERVEIMEEETSVRGYMAQAAIDNYWPKTTDAFYSTAIQIVDHNADNATLLIQLEELSSWCLIKKLVSHIRNHFSTLISILEFEETSLRQIIMSQREEELHQTITVPMQESLHQMLLAFNEDVFENTKDGLRIDTEREEARAALELEAESGFLTIAHGYYTDDSFFWINQVRVERQEKEVRTTIIDEMHAEQLGLMEHLAEFHLDAVRWEIHEEQLKLPLEHLEATETMWRLVDIEPQEKLEWTTIMAQFEEGCQRVVIRHDEAISSIGVLMMIRHLQFLDQKLFVNAVDMSKRTYSAFCTKRDAISNKEATKILYRCVAGLHDRLKLGRFGVDRKASVFAIQRIGRAFYHRRRTAVLFAEQIEHCFIYAEEVLARQRIEKEEIDSLNFAVKFQQFVGTSYLRSWGRVAQSNARLQRDQSTRATSSSVTSAFGPKFVSLSQPASPTRKMVISPTLDLSNTDMQANRAYDAASPGIYEDDEDDEDEEPPVAAVNVVESQQKKEPSRSAKSLRTVSVLPDEAAATHAAGERHSSSPKPQKQKPKQRKVRGSTLFEVPAWQSSKLHQSRNSNPAPRLMRRLTDIPSTQTQLRAQQPLGPTDGSQFIETMEKATASARYKRQHGGLTTNPGVIRYSSVPAQQQAETDPATSTTTSKPTRTLPQPPKGMRPSSAVNLRSAAFAPTTTSIPLPPNTVLQPTPPNPRRRLEFTTPRDQKKRPLSAYH